MRLSVKELQKYPYPNLMAEIMESHYSICTLGEHMELGRYLSEDSPKVWDKLTGKTEILYNETVGLMSLFEVGFGYLFSNELKIIDEKPYAYWRWREFNRRREQERKEYQMKQEINIALSGKPYLLDLISKIISMNEKELSLVIDFMKMRMIA